MKIEMSGRILLIEDDNDARLLLKKALTASGYTVEELAEGSSFVNNDPLIPDLFIFDNSLPNIDGIALTKYLRIKEQTRNIPVLIVSANAHVSTRARNAGASGFIAKPFHVNYFLDTVKQLLSANAAPMRSD